MGDFGSARKQPARSESRTSLCSNKILRTGIEALHAAPAARALTQHHGHLPSLCQTRAGVRGWASLNKLSGEVLLQLSRSGIYTYVY